MKYDLSDICDYAKGKIDVAALNEDTYISTENMIPHKEGISKASSLPTTKQTQAFLAGDVLVSNIRPYFKKIWFAEYDGGCSNDVLVFRARNDVNKRFLYYVLADDAFFDYSMATSKGTKMPRGDKVAIMKYKVPKFTIEGQKKIADILESFDRRIELNNAINKNLEEQAFTLFDSYFPSSTVGDRSIGDYVTPKRGKGLLAKNAVFGEIPVIAGGLEPSTYHNVANTSSPVLTISASGANAGFVKLWDTPVWSSDSSYIDLSMTPYVYFWYTMLKKRQKEIYDAQTGSAQPHIYPQHIASMPVVELDIISVSTFTEQVTPLFQMIGANLNENSRLASIRDAMLPRLMSGSLDVSDLDL